MKEEIEYLKEVIKQKDKELFWFKVGVATGSAIIFILQLI